jgi:hypothetical protein
VINLGNGRTVSLRQPYSIILPANNWTDFCLPYRFNIRIGDVVSATALPGEDGKKLLVYEWQRDLKGRYTTREFYLPLNQALNDPNRELALTRQGERIAYSVWNDLDREVELKIPPTPPAFSRLPAQRAKAAGGWSLAVRPSTEAGELSPVFCAYVPGGGTTVAYPRPPSWQNVSVGIYDPQRSCVFGNVIARTIENGGYSYELVFENGSSAPVTVSYSIERLAGTNVAIAVIDPETGAVECGTSGLTVSLNAQSRAYRWLAVGSQVYVQNFGQTVGTGGFSLLRVAPNPFKGAVRIEYRLPYGGIESVRCELIDQRGRTVWSVAQQRAHPGKNIIAWNPSGRHRLAAGTYILRLSGLDGFGIKKAEKLAKIMYLP